MFKYSPQGKYIRHDEKFIIKLSVCFICFSFFLWCFMGIHENHIKKIDISNYELIGNAEGFLYGIDSARYINNPIDGDFFEINGWCIKRGVDCRPVSMHVVLQKGEECCIIPTVIEERVDITKGIKEGFDYDWSGFKAYFIYTNGFFDDLQAIKAYILYEVDESQYMIPIDFEIEEG